MDTPDDAGIDVGHVSKFSSGFVQVSGSASGPVLAGGSFQKWSERQDRTGAFRRLRRQRPGCITSVLLYIKRKVGGHSRRPEKGSAPSQTLDACRGKFHTPGRLNLHKAAGSERRRDDHDRATTRHIASQQ